MEAEERRKQILNLLTEEKRPIKGQELAERFNVTRQVIVKDMAILKVSNPDIIPTYWGYVIIKENEAYRRIFTVSHGSEEIEDELKTILRYGGTIEDLTVEHPYYGEIKANLYISTINEMEKFLTEFRESGSRPLSEITMGVHSHTVKCRDEESLDLIEKELREKGILLEE